MNKRVAIVASGTSNGAYLVEQTLVGEINHPRFNEFWALNHQCLWIKHDLGFIIDDSSMFETDCPLLFEYVSSKNATPFYTCQSNYPQGMDYPIDDVVTALNDDLLNNVGCYAIGYAIARGYDMTLYGMDYLWDAGGDPLPESKAFYERGGQAVSYLIGLARGMGLNVTITAPSPLLDINTVRIVDGKARRKLYGYINQPAMGHLPPALGVEGTS